MAHPVHLSLKVPARRVSSIDCGTNSFKITIADVQGGLVRPVLEERISCRIGEGMRQNGARLREAPMRRALEALETFAGLNRALGVTEEATIGTSALREARNAGDFVRRAKERTGLSIEVLSGGEEARLSYLAVRRDPAWRPLPQLFVIDVGGGSTEFVVGEEGTDAIAYRASLPIGAVGLTEERLRSDPPSAADLTNTHHAVALAIEAAGITARCGTGCGVVGVGGAVTSLGAMSAQGAVDGDALHGCTIEVEELEMLCTRLSSMSLVQRRTVPGLEPARADIALAGSILTLHAVTAAHAKQIAISTRGLRWGLIYDRFIPQSCSDL